jgi:hypothetical protein
MRLPAHFNLTLSPDDRADLYTAHQAFLRSMQSLSYDEQLRRARVTASGIRESDPYTKALARQFVDGAEAKAKILRLQNDLKGVERELKEGGYRPKDPHWRGAALERKEALQSEIELTHARLLAVAEDKLETAQKKAAVEFRERRQQAAKTAALKNAIATEEARLEAEAIQRQAAAIARSRRMNAGGTDRSAGESQ